MNWIEWVTRWRDNDEEHSITNSDHQWRTATRAGMTMNCCWLSATMFAVTRTFHALTFSPRRRHSRLGFRPRQSTRRCSRRWKIAQNHHRLIKRHLFELPPPFVLYICGSTAPPANAASASLCAISPDCAARRYLARAFWNQTWKSTRKNGQTPTRQKNL